MQGVINSTRAIVPGIGPGTAPKKMKTVDVIALVDGIASMDSLKLHNLGSGPFDE